MKTEFIRVKSMFGVIDVSGTVNFYGLWVCFIVVTPLCKDLFYIQAPEKSTDERHIMF